MNTLIIIIDVMFAMYIYNFVTGLFIGMEETHGLKTRSKAEIIFGIILLIAVIIANQATL